MGVIYQYDQQYSAAMAVDHVVDQGTDGIWDYRRWASGIYELWGNYEATGLVLTTASQNTYYGTDKTINLPSFSIACNYVLATESRTVHAMGSGIYVFCTQYSTTNITLEFRSHASQSNAEAGVQIYVRGRWK